MMKRIATTLALVTLGVLTACSTVVPASPVPSLPGTNWVVAAINGKPTIADNQPKLAFEPSGQVSGATGCNVFSGPYTSSGSDLSFPSPLATTMMACIDDGVADQEMALLAALETVKSVRGNGSDVEVLDAAGAVVLLLKPAA